MSRGLKTTIAILAVLVMVGLFTLRGLRQGLQRIRRPPITEQQARREVMQVPVSTPTDVKAAAQMYWLSPSSSGASLEAATVEIPLSADPVERSKQLLDALISMAPSPDRRTLPPDATLLGLYIQPDGTGIADFSDEVQTGIPSGILSELLAVNSITQTLGANKTGIHRLKILIHGQDADTLAGHLDLSGYFAVPSSAPATGAPVAAAGTLAPQGAPAASAPTAESAGKASPAGKSPSPAGPAKP
ncbi:MAG: GerMN domain-containing protein [Candidatus Acidiferrales bacterium]